MLPVKKYQSGNDWILAASLGVILLGVSPGWTYELPSVSRWAIIVFETELGSSLKYLSPNPFTFFSPFSSIWTP